MNPLIFIPLLGTIIGTIIGARAHKNYKRRKENSKIMNAQGQNVKIYSTDDRARAK